MNNFILIQGIFILSIFASSLDAKVVEHNFFVNYFSGSPDGVYTEMILGINGQFPGPTIYADVGDTLVVNLVNNIQHGDQNTSLHWHGIHQNGTIFEDGTNMITQCPLKNGQQQRYTIPLHQAGTFWYHSHVLSQYSEGLWGVLIVRPIEEAHSYDDEIIITLSDWYHTTAKQNEEWLLSTAGGGAQPIPHAGLINGVGRYHCDYAARYKRFCDPTLQMRPVFHVQRNKTYRVRVIATSAIASFNFSIDGHPLEIIEVDSTEIAKSVPTVDLVPMGSGQRYSFLIKTTNLDSDRFLIRVNLRMEFYLRHPENHNINLFREATMANMTAVLEYTTNLTTRTFTLEKHSYLDQDPPPNIVNPVILDETKLTPLDGHIAPSHYDKEIVIETGFYLHSDGLRRAAFNATPFFLPKDKPLVFTLLDNEPIPESVFPVEIDHMNIIQVVVNNPFWNPHPLHLHGHDFWVMGSGKWWDGNYDPTKNNLTLTGARRDTVFIEEQSWVVIRFVADNPGLWTFHCHIDWHNLSGMALVFVEAKDIAIQNIKVTDEAQRICDMWK